MNNQHRPSVFPFVMYVLATSMIFAAFALVLGLQIVLRHDILTNRQNGLVNQAYIRTVACMASVQPNARTPQYVKSCYAKAEATTGVKIEHYGDGR
jgi:hypothetical protein